MGISFSSDSIYGLPPGYRTPNAVTNPYAEGGAMFGQGYGTGRQTLPNGPVPSNNYTVGQNLAPKANAKSSSGWFNVPLTRPPATQAPTTQSTTPEVQTTITPEPVYTPQDTRAATNQAVADAQRNANLRWLQKPYDKPGVSRSAGQLALAIPQAQEYISQGALNAQQIPFSDATVNSQNILRGQTARDTEGLGLANVLAQFNSANTGFNTSQNTSLMNLIASLLGGQLNSSSDLGSLLGGL